MTIAMRDRFDPDEHPELLALPFDPPLLHDVTLIWLPESDSPTSQAFADRCCAGRAALAA